MKADACATNSAAIRKKEQQEKAIADGNFEGALGYSITIFVPTAEVREVQIIVRPYCIIKRPKKELKS